MANGLYTGTRTSPPVLGLISPSEAAKNYELLWSADQSNAHALAQLITALSRCNLKQAEQVRRACVAPVTLTSAVHPANPCALLRRDGCPGC